MIFICFFSSKLFDQVFASLNGCVNGVGGKREVEGFVGVSIDDFHCLSGESIGEIFSRLIVCDMRVMVR